MAFLQELMENQKCKMDNFKASWHKVSGNDWENIKHASYIAKTGLEEI